MYPKFTHTRDLPITTILCLVVSVCGLCIREQVTTLSLTRVPSG